MMKMPVQVKLLLKLHKLESNKQSSDTSEAFQEIAKNLDPSLLKRYLRLKERKGTGVAVLEKGMCSACRMVYPETHEMLRYGNFIHTCEFCSRFLLLNGTVA
jgi:predicted  nucleic acid-binding Zn-ribbon protein